MEQWNDNGTRMENSEVWNLPLQDRETYHNGLNSLGTTLCKQVIKRIDVEIYKSLQSNMKYISKALMNYLYVDMYYQCIRPRKIQSIYNNILKQLWRMVFFITVKTDTIVRLAQGTYRQEKYMLKRLRTLTEILKLFTHKLQRKYQ